MAAAGGGSLSAAAQAWPSRLRRQWRRGPAPLLYRLAQGGLLRCGLQQRLDVRLWCYIAAAPWRLRPPARAPRELRIREIGVGEMADLARLQRERPHWSRAPLPPAEIEYRRRFGESHRCVAAYLGGRCVAQLWLAPGPTRLRTQFGFSWIVPATTLWIYDLATDAAIVGVPAHLYAWLRQHPPGAGYTRMAGQIEFDNVASRQLHRSLGFSECGLVGSVRVGRHWTQISRAAERRRWCWHRGGHIRVEDFDGVERRAGPAMAVTPESGVGQAPWWRCGCGRRLALSAAVRLQCGCGRAAGQWRDGVAAMGEPMPYWGEIDQEKMQAVLTHAAVAGWRTAVSALVPRELHDYIYGEQRAAFHQALPVPASGRILDVGAGWGGISLGLARRYQVTALEGVDERARFIALRARQERLAVTVVRSDALRQQFLPGQFDAIVVNGVLEWVPLLDLSAPPEVVQEEFLRRLRTLLAPGGVIYLGIENRFGRAEWAGALDHSGLRYTSLLPRPLARLVCARSGVYRAHFNTGYRTYTYSHRGYRQLFERAGLGIATTWISPGGYNEPSRLVPLRDAAIRFARRPSSSRIGALAARAWVWRWFGSDFVFLLRAAGHA